MEQADRLLRAWASALVVVLPLGVACASAPHRPGSTVIATTGIPTVSTATPTQERAALGATIEVTIETLKTDGGTVKGTADYTVANLHPIAPVHSYPEVKGTLYSVDVTVQTISGVVIVHPWNFALRTEDGTNLTPDLNAVDNGLPATDLPQGQKVSGPIAVDVPPGKTITEIVLSNGIGGTQLGLWSVG